MKFNLDLESAYFQYANGIFFNDDTNGIGCCDEEDVIIDHIWDHYGCEMPDNPLVGDPRSIPAPNSATFGFIEDDNDKWCGQLFGVVNVFELGYLYAPRDGVQYPDCYKDDSSTMEQLMATYDRVKNSIENGLLQGVEKYEHSKLMLTFIENELHLVVFTPIMVEDNAYSLPYSDENALVDIDKVVTNFLSIIGLQKDNTESEAEFRCPVCYSSYAVLEKSGNVYCVECEALTISGKI